MKIDLFQEGMPLDNKGMKYLQGALKNPEVISALKEIAIASSQQPANNMELASKLLDMISKSGDISSYLSEKGPSIVSYIQNSVDTQIQQEAGRLQQWNKLLANESGLDAKHFKKEKIKFLKKAGITGQKQKETLQSGALPKGLEHTLSEYGLATKDVKQLLKIVPILLNSPSELKQMLDAINAGNYTDVARQVIDLAEEKPEIKEYLNNNKEVFAKIIDTMMSGNEQFAASGLGGQVYDLVPALFNNPTALKEIIALYDQEKYYEIAPKIFDLVATDPDVKAYFSKNTTKFEALINNTLEDNIAKSITDLAEENQAWQQLDKEAQRLYLDTDENWKETSSFAKDRMIEKGKLQDLGETLELYGIEKRDIAALSHIVMMTFNSPSNLSGVLSAFAKSDYTGMTHEIFRLFEESPEINAYLKSQEAFIGRIIKANLLYSPEFKNIDVTELVPFLLDHPEELREIVKLVQDGKYTEIAPKILELSQEDRGIADYLAKNKVALTEIVLKSTGFDTIGLSNEVADIFVHLTTENNLPKLQSLAELARTEEWLKVGIGLADLIDKDVEFQASLKDNRTNINKIVKRILIKNPALRSSLAGIEAATLVNNIISDPASVRDLLTAYESGSTLSMAAQVTSFATKKIFDTEFTGALYNSAVNWISGQSKQQEQIVTAITGALNNRENPNERIVLSDFVAQAFNEISENISIPKEKKKFLKQIGNKNFFEGSTLEGTNETPLQLHNLDINGNQFVNTVFKNVSFEGSKFTESAFHGASFINTTLRGATIDGATLSSLLPAIRKGSLSLNGVKIEGSLDKLDLKGISFEGADLSAVTSMHDTNLAQADLQAATLPSTKSILTHAFNLTNAEFADGAISESMINENQQQLSNKITTQLAARSLNRGKMLSSDEKQQLETKINELYNDESIIGERFRQAINANPEKLFAHAFPEDSALISHVSEYRGSTSHQLTMLYNNATTPEQIEATLVADIIAEQVTKNLFADGANRGKDGLQIQAALTAAVIEFAATNETTPKAIIESPDFERMVTEITSQINTKTKNTTVGLVTSGIYLPDNAITENMIQGFTDRMNQTAGDTKLTVQEISAIQELATSIASNIFGENAKTSNAADIKNMEALLAQTLYKTKSEHPNLDIEAALNTNKEKLVGSLDRGYFSTAGEGLTKLFYDNTNLLGNGLSEDINTSKFKASLKENITSVIPENITPIIPERHLQHVEKSAAQKIGQTLDANSTTKKAARSAPPRNVQTGKGAQER